MLDSVATGWGWKGAAKKDDEEDAKRTKWSEGDLNWGGVGDTSSSC